MKVDVVSLSSQKKTTVDADPVIFDRAFNSSLVHEIVTTYLHNARAGTAKQKNRSAVSGGGAKPWRQKGTGRARAGTIRGPIWRGGGVTFASQPREFNKKVNRKVYRQALRVILSELRRMDRLIVVEQLQMATPKTKEFLKVIEPLDIKKALFIEENLQPELHMATRNIPHIDVLSVHDVTPVDLLKYEHVCVSVNAFKKLEGQLQ